MPIYDYYSQMEIEAFLRAQRELEASSEHQRQKVVQPTTVLHEDRQKIDKTRGRPRKFDPDSIIDAYERECLLGDWGEPSPTLREFCSKAGISESHFREIRRRYGKDEA